MLTSPTLTNHTRTRTISRRSPRFTHAKMREANLLPIRPWVEEADRKPVLFARLPLARLDVSTYYYVAVALSRCTRTGRCGGLRRGLLPSLRSGNFFLHRTHCPRFAAGSRTTSTAFLGFILVEVFVMQTSASFAEGCLEDTISTNRRWQETRQVRWNAQFKENTEQEENQLAAKKIGSRFSANS